MKIAMVLNKENRELPIMEKFKRWLLHHQPACEVIIVDYHHHNFCFDIIDFEPDVIITFPFTAISTASGFYLAKFISNCHIVCFRTEGVINFDFERQVMGNVGIEEYGSNFVDYELFWGKRFASVVGGMLFEHKKLSSLGRIKTFGYPPYEAYLSTHHTSRTSLSTEHLNIIKKFEKDKVLFFITGFPLADYTEEDLINSGDCFDPAGTNVAKELMIASKGVKRSAFFRNAWVHEITKTAGKHPDALLIVKSHPIEQIICERRGIDPYASFREYDNIVYISTSIPISEVMPHSGLFVHYGSTAVGEAYLAGVPSIFVSIDEAFQEKVSPETAMYYHNDLGWPSSYKIEIEELQPLVDRHIESPLKHEMTPLMKQILLDQFNITDSHLADGLEYVPSQDVALFLLGLRYEAPQKILASDQYLQNAVRTLGGGVIAHLCSSGYVALYSADFTKAAECFRKALMLLDTMHSNAHDIEFLYACSLARSGGHDAARQVVLKVLDQDPSHKDSRNLLLYLDKTHNSPTEREPVMRLGGPSDIHNVHNTSDPRKESEPVIPHIFTVETTLACDLRCPECAIGGGMIKRTKGLMTFDQYKIIADKIRPYAQYVYLHIWGEPMLNQDIFEMIRYTSEFARTNISTNGISMTREKAERLILSGVSDIIVSIDGVSQGVYEKYRVGGNVSKAFDALSMLNEINIHHGNRVNLIPQFVVFQHNEHEMNDFVQRCNELGLQPSFKAPYIRKEDSHFKYSGNPKYHRPHFSDKGELRDAMRDCPNPREVFTVLEDGSVVACCHDYAGVTSFGNIFRQEVLEIWNTYNFVNFREAVASGHAPEFCINNCMTWLLDKTQKVMTTVNNANDAVPKMINLCCGPVILPDFINIDATPGGDIQLDLELQLLPFPDESIDAVICISAINYFSYQRGAEIIKDVFRVLKPGGVARFATQDLGILTRNYLERNEKFYFEKLSNGTDRFPGKTYADKLNQFFYGFYSGDKHCKYVYDYESLANHFQEAGFGLIEKKAFRESKIPGSDKFDNRPEQMFFLEAVKERASVLQIAKDYWSKNLDQRAWQYLLKALDEDPGHREAVDMCANVLVQHGRRGDLAKLYQAYLSRRSDDLEIIQRFQENEVNLAQSHEWDARLPERRGQLEELNHRRNSILPDREHLAACMAWLRRAQEANGQGGVSAVYYLDKECWEVDYPETTGYIISTFLTYYRLVGDKQYLTLAQKMGDWEIDIQAPGGGAGEPLGVYGLQPRVFNTGQVMLGWVALYRETADTKYLDAARRAGDWVLASLDSDGKWSRNTYNGPHAYKSRVSWALLELFDVCGEEKYRVGAELSLSWILDQARYNGWFENNSLSEPGKPWTHLIGYVLVGLLEVCRLSNARIDRKQILKLLHSAALGMIKHYLAAKAISKGNYVTLAATFDCNWDSNDAWTCVTGTTQVEFFLRRLSLYVDNPVLVKTADMMLDDIKRLHFIDGISDPNVYGGLQGAFPIGVGYATYSIPNWGVKFFADSLLQRLLPLEQQIVIG